ncbi:MAG: MGMT family protein [bacterium]|nr:MGMT family protein [bacterium]
MSLRQYDAILAIVESIPAGRVATYGQIADLAGLPGRARLVGTTLRKLPDDSAVPWHRVVNAGGRISARGDGMSETEQELLLADEGVVIDVRGRIRLAAFQWCP